MISPCKPPLSIPAPKPKRLPLVKCMTITVGFICSNGIVLGADSQESFEGSALKRSVSKLTAFPSLESEQGKSPDRRAVFTGSGDSQLIDKLIEELSIEVASAGPSIEEIAGAIEKRIKQMYREYRNCYHAGYMPSAEITYGLWCGGKIALFHAQGPIVKQIGTTLYPKGRTGHKSMPPFRVGYKATGQGTELTDYINARMSIPMAINVSEAVVLGTYMLEQAVEHASGCGGAIRLMWIAEDGTADMVDTGAYTSALLKGLDSQLSQIFIAMASYASTDKQMETAWDDAKKILLKLREEWKQGVEKTQKHKEQISDLLQEWMDDPEAARKKYIEKANQRELS